MHHAEQRSGALSLDSLEHETVCPIRAPILRRCLPLVYEKESLAQHGTELCGCVQSPKRLSPAFSNTQSFEMSSLAGGTQPMNT